MSNQLQVSVIGGTALLVGSAFLYWQLETKARLLEEIRKQNLELEKTIEEIKKAHSETSSSSPSHENKPSIKFQHSIQPKPAESTEPRKRIAILTSGGDSCGMNAALRSLIRVGIQHGAEMYVIYEGYAGLVTGGKMIQKVDWNFVGGILHRGGTVIGTARCAEFRTVEGRKTAVFNLVQKKIDCLVVIGGDGSLTGADFFRKEWKDHLNKLVTEKVLDPKVLEENEKLSIVGLVGSIDNDMFGTDMTIGTDTALHRILEAIDAVLSTATSHRRSFIVEVMGRNCGYLALMAALCTGASWVFIPESPPQQGWEDDMVRCFTEARKGGARCIMAIMAEGAVDHNGNPISSETVRQILAKAGHEARITILGHVQRGGITSALDRNNSTMMGDKVIRTLMKPKYFGESVLVGMEGTKVVRLPLMKCVETTKDIGRSMEKKEWDKVIDLRGQLFRKTFELQKILSDTAPRYDGPPPKRKNIGVLHIGAPAPGMNTAVRVITRLALRRGFQVYAFKNGIKGLEEGNAQFLDWTSVNGWAISGGVNMGTLRHHQSEPLNLEAVSNTLKRLQIQTLIMIGGYDGYEFMARLLHSRSQYPVFNIPLICLPASISNNLPGSDLAIGSDTALNNIMNAIDKIKQSSGISQRVFVIEVMGGYSGYLAVTSSLACGAEFTHIHERKLSLTQLQEESNILIDRFKAGKNISLVIMNEKANPTYNTEFVFSLLDQEAHGLYDVRKCILGHVQQGGAPSPADRILASQLSDKAFEVLEQHPEIEEEEPAVMVGIVDGQMVFTDLAQFDELVDTKHRRPKKDEDSWWFPKLCALNDQLGTEPQTVSNALKHTVENAIAREQTNVATANNTNLGSNDQTQQKDPEIYRSWTFERFDYNKAK